MTGKPGESSTAAFRRLKRSASNTPAFFHYILAHDAIYSLAQLLMPFLFLVLWHLTRRLCATRINYAIRHNLPEF